MKFGIITDSHLGIDDRYNKDIIDLLYDIESYFKEENINNIIHLGDMIHESDNVEFNIKKVTEIFEDYNRYLTLGNHDVIKSDESMFKNLGWVCSGSISVDKNRYIKLIDTVKEAKHDNIGYIPEKEIESIRDMLRKGYDLTILSHYPLEKIYETEVFQDIPERGYPINKDELFIRCDHREYKGSIESVFCGHQHPKRTREITGRPTNIDITIFEPVINFEVDSNGVQADINTDINMSDLVVDI